MAMDCGHTGTGMTWFAVGDDYLALCSRCHAVVTKPWHDKLRETSDALAEAQREQDVSDELLFSLIQITGGSGGWPRDAIRRLCDQLEAIQRARREETEYDRR